MFPSADDVGRVYRQRVFSASLNESQCSSLRGIKSLCVCLMCVCDVCVWAAVVEGGGSGNVCAFVDVT